MSGLGMGNLDDTLYTYIHDRLKKNETFLFFPHLKMDIEKQETRLSHAIKDYR